MGKREVYASKIYYGENVQGEIVHLPYLILLVRIYYFIIIYIYKIFNVIYCIKNNYNTNIRLYKELLNI